MTNKNFWRVIVSAVMLICTCIIVSSTANAEEVIVFDNTTVSYTVQQGAVYYESSWRNGTGATGVIGGKYANGNPCYVHVDGYSVLDNDGNILKSYFEEKKLLLEIPKKHDGEILMVHISGADPNGGYRLGWISYDSISRITTGTYQAIEIESKKDIRIEKIPEKKVEETVDIVKEKIAEDVVKTRESVVLADFSGSMAGFHEEVMQKLQYSEGSRYLFAESVTKYVQDKEWYQYEIGGGTNLYGAINTIMESCPEDAHIYILSDLCDNVREKLKYNINFKGVITIAYYQNNNDLEAKECLENIREHFPKAKIEVC